MTDADVTSILFKGLRLVTYNCFGCYAVINRRQPKDTPCHTDLGN